MSTPEPDDHGKRVQLNPEFTTDFIKAIADAGELALMGINPGLERFGIDQPQTTPDDEAEAALLIIGDEHKLAETITALTPQDHQEQQVTEVVEALLKNTADLVLIDYADVVDAQDEADRVLGDMSVSEHLDKFGVVKPVLEARDYSTLDGYKRLSDYVRYRSLEQLTEYIDAETKGLTLDGPLSWLDDPDPQNLWGKWHMAFNHLTSLRDSGESPSFYQELFTKLRGDFEASIDQLETCTDEEDVSALLDAMYELTPEWDDQFPQENRVFNEIKELRSSKHLSLDSPSGPTEL